MSDTQKFDWKKPRHWKHMLWRLYYNTFRPRKHDKLPLWDDYLSDEYIARVDQEIKHLSRDKK